VIRLNLAYWSRAVAAAVVGGLCFFAAWKVTAQNVTSRLMQTDPEAALIDPSLRAAALPIGERVYREHCADCHGDQALRERMDGVPNLFDADHLYESNSVAAVENIVRHGIRSGDNRGWGLAAMPAYATLTPYGKEPIPFLSPAEIRDVTEYVMSLSGAKGNRSAMVPGSQIFSGKAGCYDCHSPDGRGDRAIGAPDLTDADWLYGDGSAEAVARSIAAGRAGRMPGFSSELSPIETRAVAAFVASRASREARNTE
jgi:cytochrome c oxidase cbb3-type subunit 3